MNTASCIEFGTGILWFFSKMKDSVASVEGNTEQCANGTQPKIEEDLQNVKANISHICPYPCSSNPCLNDGNCLETSWKDYTCQCEEGFSGENCSIGKSSDIHT